MMLRFCLQNKMLFTLAYGHQFRRIEKMNTFCNFFFCGNGFMTEIGTHHPFIG